MGGTLVCIVCGTNVGPEMAACPACSEPRSRICRCGAIVELDVVACPSCHRKLGRVVSLPVRARRRLVYRLWVGAGVAVVLGGVAAVVWPHVQGARARASLRSEGAAALADGRVAEAIRQLTDYLRVHPEDVEAHHLLAEAHFAAGEASAGVAEAGTALELQPGRADTHILLARHHFAAGESIDAVAHGRAAHDPRASAIVGRALVALGRLSEGARELGDAMRSAPDDILLRLDAAEVHARLGEFDWSAADDHRRRAHAVREDVLARDVRSIEAAAGATLAGRVSWARALVRAGRRDDAVAALGAEPGGAAPVEARIDRATLLARAAGAARAETELRAALAARPSDAGAAAALARVLLDGGRVSDAVAVVSATDLGDGPRPAAFLAVAAEAQRAHGDESGAVRSLGFWRDAAPRDPRPLRALIELRVPESLARRRMGLESADTGRGVASQLDTLGALDTEDATFLAWRIRADDLAGRSEESDHRLARLVALYPEEPAPRELRIARAFAGLGATPPEKIAAELRDDASAPGADLHAFTREALRAGRPHLALDVLSAARERRPDDGPLTAAIARTLLALGRPAAAAARLGELPEAARAEPAIAALHALSEARAGSSLDIAALAPPDADVRRMTGVAAALAAAGRIEDADALLRRARAAAGTDEAALRRVAESYEDAGRADDAIAVWDSIAAAAPRDAEAIERSAVVRLTRETVSADDRVAAARRVERLRALPNAEIGAHVVRSLFASASATAQSSDIRRIAAALPDRQDLRFALARAEFGSGAFGEAARNAATVVHARPASIRARELLADALVAGAAADIGAGRLAAAIDGLERAAAATARAPAVGRTPGPRLTETCAAAVAARVRGLAAARPEDTALRLLRSYVDGDAASARTAAADPAGPVGAALVAAALDTGPPEVGRQLLEAASERDTPAVEVAWVRAAVAAAGPERAAETIALRAATVAAPSHAHARAVLAALAGETDAAALEDVERLLSESPGAADRLDLAAWGAALARGGRRAAARTAFSRAAAYETDRERAEAHRKAAAGVR